MIARHPNPCSHEFQDAKYGEGFRVMNPAYTAGKLTGYRCTVCGPAYIRVSEGGNYNKKRTGIYDISSLQVK